MSWLEQTSDSTYALRYSRLDGDTWRTPVTIAERADFFVNWADFPSVVATDSGALVAHWLQRSGAGRYAYDARITWSTDEGQRWSEGSLLNRDGVQAEHGFVALWPAGGNAAEAAWLDGRATASSNGSSGARGAMQVRFARLEPGSAPAGEVTLDARTCDCCQVAATRTRRGPVVAYRDRSDEEIRDIVVTRRVGGTWTAPVPVHNDGWHIEACPVNGPALASRGDTVVIAWFTGARDTARVNVAWSFDAGASFAPPARVDDGDPLGRVDVRLLTGGAVVSWLERADSSVAELRVRRARPAGTLSAPVTLASTSVARASGVPRLVTVGDALVAAWTQPGDSARVRLTRLALSSLP